MFEVMKDSFLALWANNSDQNTNTFSQIQCELKQTRIDQLTAGEVTIKVHYSGINYKDALAVCGKGKILKKLPLIPGVDMSGIVIESGTAPFKEGDKVLINGAELGEHYCGGFSEVIRVPASLLIPLPQGLNLREAMIYGTAGFTAALALHRLEYNGLSPKGGAVLVTGATGGVGSLALSFLNKKGYVTQAWTRKKNQDDFLKKCGATKITHTSEMDFKCPPLAKGTWAGAIDNVGGDVLSYILPHMKLWSGVASIGMAQSQKLETTVFPFILRGVSLIGASSNNCPQDLRSEIWLKLANEYKPTNLEDLVYKEVSLKEVPEACKDVLNSKHFGRILVHLTENPNL